MDKLMLQQQVLERLTEDPMQAENALRTAHEENIAEYKYDTWGSKPPTWRPARLAAPKPFGRR